MASLKSVADAAGVSVSSVSNAYNRPGQLSDDVRERILAVAREQGYAGPDAAARSLRSKRAGAIGMLFTERLSYAFSDPYSVGFLAGIAEIAEQSRTGILLIPLAPMDGTSDEAIAASVEVARQAVVDAVAIYCVDPGHPARQVMRNRGLPMVTSSEKEDLDGIKAVLIDEAGAGRRIGRLIRRLGHRRVGILVDSNRPAGDVLVIGSDDNTRVDDEAWQRLIGYREGLGRGTEITVVTGGYNSIEAGEAAAGELLDTVDRPTALLCASDVMALGALRAVRQRGLEPGRDVSVTGFDDIPAAEPAGLTTIHQPIREKGRLMGRMLLDPSYTETRVVLPTTLVVRSSTGPAPTT